MQDVHASSSNILKTKKQIIISVGLGLAAAAAGAFLFNSAGTNAAVGGPNCNVPGDYPTIQAAVSDPGCSTVRVAAGNYAENVVINRSVNVKGAKSGVPVNQRSFGSSSESEVTGTAADTATFTINASKVTLDGFSISNKDHGTGVTIKSDSKEVTVKKNIVDGVGNDTYPAPTVGVYLENGPDVVYVSGNRITNIKSGGGSAQGSLVGDSTSGNPSLGVRIDANEITKISSTTRGAYGVQANNGASTVATATGYSEVKIRGNTIKDLSGNWAHAIGLEGETPNAIVMFNTISNLTDTAPVPIADAIAVNFESNPFFFTANVNRNSLAVGQGNFGIAVNPALTNQYPSLEADGECNWWGSRSGPGSGLGSVGTGTGSKVTTGVDYKPWLRSADLGRNCDDRERDNDHHHGDDNDHHNNDKRGDYGRRDND